MPKVSVIIITKNEEVAIEGCLKSVMWADEIIVVDSGSVDRTIEICKSYGAKVTSTNDWPGFGQQKNRALKLATNEWVFSIDADERITPELQAEIQNALNDANKKTAFRIPRKSSYCGQFINYSGWWPDYVTRLFPRHGAKFSDDLVHERIVFEGEIKTLKEPLIHMSHTDLEEVLNKTNRYTSDGAAMLFAQGKKSSLKKAILHGVWAFIRTYIIRRGFLDGRMGLILAISYAEGTYYRYLKLMMLNEKNNHLAK
jgi:glycosyltransferase involved in cell wall biosynthesis